MYFITSGKKLKGKVIAIAVAAAFSVLLAVVVSLCFSGRSGDSTEYSFDLRETGGVSGFFAQFSLDYESLLNTRELTLPAKDDETFVGYGDFQSKIGLDILRFSGKKVEERYLKLKNKSKSGKPLYAVLYIIKDKVIACHLTTLEEGSELLLLTAFV
ncbi:MAG: DUF4830 domain-containing protein [Clostridia bacterium]|nr:DUF4830 domain-containing protein [Clostridia bacterium]